MIWLTGGALAVAVMMIVGLLVLVVYQGLQTFWPEPVEAIVTDDGNVYLGEIAGEQSYRAQHRAGRLLSPDGGRSRAPADRGRRRMRSRRQNLRIENLRPDERALRLDRREFRIRRVDVARVGAGRRTS